MLTNRQMFSLVALTFPLVACSALDKPMEQNTADMSTVGLLPSDLFSNGLSQNGLHVNGLDENGLIANGLISNGLDENGVGVAVSGIGKSGVDADGNVIEGIEVEGAELVAPGMSGDDFVGVTLTLYLTNGASVPLRIDDVAPSTTNAGHWLYQLTLPTANGASACGYDADGNPRQALALSGRWDPSMGTATGGDFIDDPNLFSFGCTNSAIAKCLRMGYEPWNSIEECDASGVCQTVSLRAYHQACTRMVRADYCGDGTPHTTNGVPINVWDEPGIQERAETSSDYLRDSEWSADGAVCVSNFRRDTDGAKRAYVEAFCPERLAASFPCFGDQSTFFPANASNIPLSQRSLVRNEFKILPQP